MLYRMITIGFLLFVSGQNAYAQYFPQSNDTALRGIRTFDANIVIPGWLAVMRDEDQFRTDAQSAFVTGLRREGISVDPSAPNYLLCVLTAAQVDDQIFFTRDVQYWEWSSNGLNRLIWEAGGVVTRTFHNFDHEEVARGCVDQFT